MSISKPLRRSLRLTLSPTTPTSATTKTTRNNKKQPLTLALCHSPLTLALCHSPLDPDPDPEPEPLNVNQPHKLPIILYDASSSSYYEKPLSRRSPRLLAAEVGVVNGQCGSALLSNLPEKKACKLARECLDENELNVKCLRSRDLRNPSHLASPSTAKRKLDSGQHSDENPASWDSRRRSPRFSGGDSSALKGFIDGIEGISRKLHSRRHSNKMLVNRRSPRLSGDKPGDSSALKGRVDENEGKLALPCSSKLGDSGKSKKLDSRRLPDKVSMNRRSPRLSGEQLASKESSDVAKRKLRGKSDDELPLALPRSSLVENSGKFRNPDSGKELGFPNKIPSNVEEVLRRSPRFSGELAGKQLPSEELINEVERKLVSKLDNAVLNLLSSSMAENPRKFRRLDCGVKQGFNEKIPSNAEGLLRCSMRFSGNKNGDSSACSKLVAESNKSKDVPLPLVRSVMEEVGGKVEEEERVVRRSPRGLSSICLVDEYGCDEMRELELPNPKKKKEQEKERREKIWVFDGSSSSSIDKEEVLGTKKCFFVGEAVPEDEARQRWGWRYELKNRRPKGRSLTANADEEHQLILQVKCHYTEALIKGCTFHLGDCALIRGEERREHIGRIREFFQTMEGEDYFRVQWFYRAEDTVLKDAASFHDKKRVFYSTIMNDNLLECIISKLIVAQITPELISKTGSIPPSDYYYDMEYCLDYSTFRNLPRDISVKHSELLSISCPEPDLSVTGACLSENTSICEPCNAELCMLDIFAGCGAMSTGLCIGAKLSGVNLVTRWAIDCDSSACESLRLNHPKTQVKNEAAEDFLELLKHWEKLCRKFVTEDVETYYPSSEEVSDTAVLSLDAQSDADSSDEELEVLKLVDICYGDANESGKCGLKFKVRWKGYDSSEDTWEPIEGLSNCQELIQEFVINGFKNKILPLPGDVDVICGGPPCQGISGYNRFRCVDEPFSDEKNRQLVVFMDIVEYLKPKFILMENVTDILRFDKGSLGRYALSRLVHMNYQARVGIMAAGCYGLPQFRLRVFFWGALPSEELPQFPLPTHDVVVRYWPPPEFERNVVAYDEGQPSQLEDAVFLSDAISDLPAVTNFESSDEMPYNKPPETSFQKYIRSIGYDMIGYEKRAEEVLLYDHRPLQLFEDDYIRVCQIPKRKGANFRDLPGIVVGNDNVVRRDPATRPVLLPSGKPMVPEYVFNFEHGKSKRPFGRLWWDETMSTVVTYPNCHSQVILHPEQDRLLTVRECARLQGFPDSYRFCGTVKKRYRQVGNAVAIPVAKSLGYALGMASQKLISKEALMTLPPKFAYSNHL